MKCKICDADTEIAFIAKVLNKYNERFYKCSNCGFLSVGNAYWLDEAYKDAINISDTGIIYRNIILHKIVTSIAYVLFGFKENGGGIMKIYY